MKLVLTLVGGGVKGIFQLGVLKAIFDHPFSKNIEIIDIYGTSIGSLIAPFIITRRLDEVIEYIKTLRTIDDISNKWSENSIINNLYGMYNLLFYKSFYKSFNLAFLHKFKESLTYTENIEISKKLHCNVFNISTGKDEILTGLNWIDNIEASSTIPLLYPEKKIGNFSYIDGANTSKIILENKYEKDVHFLMINFEENLHNKEYVNIEKLNIYEYILKIVSQIGELHVYKDYHNFVKYNNNNNIHKISMETKFENSLDFDKYTIEFAIQEGYKKGKEWIYNIL